MRGVDGLEHVAHGGALCHRHEALLVEHAHQIAASDSQVDEAASGNGAWIAVGMRNLGVAHRLAVFIYEEVNACFFAHQVAVGAHVDDVEILDRHHHCAVGVDSAKLVALHHDKAALASGRVLVVAVFLDFIRHLEWIGSLLAFRIEANHGVALRHVHHRNHALVEVGGERVIHGGIGLESFFALLVDEADVHDRVVVALACHRCVVLKHEWVGLVVLWCNRGLALGVDVAVF